MTHETVIFAELDALALEEEEEGPSYLSDLNKVPDFVDEPPVELGEVSSIYYPLKFTYSLNPLRRRHQSDKKPSNKPARCFSAPMSLTFTACFFCSSRGVLE